MREHGAQGQGRKAATGRKIARAAGQNVRAPRRTDDVASITGLDGAGSKTEAGHKLRLPQPFSLQQQAAGGGLLADR